MMKTNRGFTLIELLVVISIIGMLSSVILVALAGAKDKGRIGAGMTQAATMYHAMGDGALLRLTFDDCDSSCSTAKDSSGNGNDGTGSGSRIGSLTGYNGGLAVKLGSGGNIAVPNSASLNPTGNFTLAFWILTNMVFNTPIAKMDTTNDSNPGWGVYMNTGRVIIKVSDGTNKYEPVSISPTVNDSNWHFVAFSVAVSSASPNCVVYFDGKKYGSTTCSNLGSISNTNPLYLGANGGSALPGTTWVVPNTNVGELDDVSLYGSAVTAMQIEHLYAEGLPAHSLASK